jgi:hypothetical protein
MDLMLIRQFQREAEYQCCHAFAYLAMVREALAADDRGDVFMPLQGAVISIGNVGKIFFGVENSGKFEPRRPLRGSVGLSDHSPIRDFSMRNNYEHIDERIDRRFEKSKTRSIINRMIGPPGMVQGIEPIGMFQHFDPQTFKLYFWGVEFDLPVIIREMEALYPRLREEAAKSHRG